MVPGGAGTPAPLGANKGRWRGGRDRLPRRFFARAAGHARLDFGRGRRYTSLTMAKRSPRSAPTKTTVRKARMADIEPIYALVNEYSRRQMMLPRSRADLYESLRDFEVADEKHRVVGCGALAIQWDDLAEIKSLAVAVACHGRGIGRRLVRACLADARRLGIGRVFALTIVPSFFEGLGFRRVPRESLPHKIWADCVRCPKFPDCDELALAIDLPAGAS